MTTNAKSQGYKYKISFVMPVYKVEDYLEETVQSILDQTLDFESNCQIIFINDGSPDNSEAVCLKYKERYPDNIVYVKKKNQGVSAARNTGIALAKGKYISFLDSDDLLSPATLERVYDFFEANHEKIDLVTVPIEFFEARSGPHPLNYRFESTRVINIEKEPSMVHLSGGASFVKANLESDLLNFDTKLKTSEDSKFVTKIILSKGAYGAVKEAKYSYRKRRSGSSAIDTVTKSRDFYTKNIELFHQELIDYCRKKYDKVPRYVQYLLMYNLQWRFRQESQTILTKQEADIYKKTLYSILVYIDDEVVLAQKNISADYKLFILGKKHNKDVVSKLQRQGLEYYFGRNKVYDYTWPIRLLVEICEERDGKLRIEGRLWGLWLPGVTLGFWVNDNFHETQEVSRPDASRSFLGEVIYSAKGFRVDVPLEEGSSIKGGLNYDGSNKRHLHFATSRQSRLLDFDGYPYRVVGKYLVCQPDATTMYVERNTPFIRLKKEVKYLISSRKYASNQKWNGIPARFQTVPLLNLAVWYRLLYFLTKPLYRKGIWIVSDRIDAAGDNGEAFFKYLTDTAQLNKTVYFTIRKSSKDYARLRKYGKVLDRDSLRFKIHFLHAEKIISSHADDFVTNAFGANQYWLRDLYNYQLVYLRHGIGLHDMSKWLNKYNKNIKLFITSTQKEYDSIVEGDYHYGPETVELTGMARYDLLDAHKSEKKLIIAPTWRKSLSSGMTNHGRQRSSEQFTSSEYYKFFNALINDERLLKSLKNNGFTGEFYLHPAHADVIDTFEGNGQIKVIEYPYNYKEALVHGSLLVTDYSSISNDFSYMKKPVIYSQFDRDYFYEGQNYDHGDFSYERDGFGPITIDYSATVSAIIHQIESGCVMEDKYRKRVDNFFAYIDQNNSKRIYDAINSTEAGS